MTRQWGEPPADVLAPRVLVAVARRHRGTAESAEAVTDAMSTGRPTRAQVHVRRCADVEDVRGLRTGVLGSGVHVGHWLEEPYDVVLRCPIGAPA
jgi:hypothetical protein